MQLTILIAALILNSSSFVAAHPGHDAQEEAVERAEFFKRNPKPVGSCESQLQRRGHVSSAVRRRAEFAIYARAKLGLHDPLAKRDFPSEYNISHASSADFTFGDDETTLFSDGSSCILQPEVTQGPYYVDGELIRKDLRENQQGVPLYLDILFVNTATCEPVPAILVDAWHCNSTGVYSGVNATGNGDADGGANLDATFLRGLQQTDSNGVVQFETIVPGHYSGRTNHIHIMSHNTNSTIIRTNGTILATNSNGTTHASHVGQIFLDQSLLAQVEATAPYASNTQTITTNEEDDILASEADNMDPFLKYMLLGDDVSDGILGWITIGIDPTTDEEIDSAATFYESGGVAHENSMGGGPGAAGGSGGPGMNGTMGGSFPSGSMSGSPPVGSGMSSGGTSATTLSTNTAGTGCSASVSS